MPIRQCITIDGIGKNHQSIDLEQQVFYYKNMQYSITNTAPKRMRVMGYIIVDPQANVVPGIPETAICVQVIAAQYILQFAIVIALCCALHRFASRVIHRSE